MIKFLFTMLLCMLWQQSAPAEGVTMIPDPPQLPVRAYILLDYGSGRVLAEHAADDKAEPASLTKIMTVFTVADTLKKGLIKLGDTTTVSEHAWKQEGSRMFINVNKPVSVDELLHGDIIQSGNDASVALAEHVSGTEEVFADTMSKNAVRLGMKATHFINSTGLPDPNHYTTARDLSTLARALIKEFPDIYRIFSQPSYTYNGIKQHNRNGLLGKDPTVDGIKTGHTEAAGFCLVASAVRSHMRLISVVLGAESDHARSQASEALLNYGYRYFESRPLFAANATVTAARVWNGAVTTLEVGAADAVFATVPRGSVEGLKVMAELQKPLVAPIAAGQPVGELVVTVDGKETQRVALIARGPVAQGAWYSRLIDRVRMNF